MQQPAAPLGIELDPAPETVKLKQWHASSWACQSIQPEYIPSQLELTRKISKTSIDLQQLKKTS